MKKLFIFLMLMFLATSAQAKRFGNVTVVGDLITSGSSTFATSVEIPNGTPVVNSSGEIGIDTTDDQLVYYGTDARVLTYKQQKCFTVEDIAEADDDVPIFTPDDAITVTDMYCIVNGSGATAQIILTDVTNDMDTITCDDNGQADDGSIANNTVSADESIYFDTGTVSGTVNWVNFCFTYTTTAE